MKNDLQRTIEILCDSYLSHDSIAKLAYKNWQEDGCPDGELEHPRLPMKIKDAHWWQAKMQLETVLEFDIDTVRIIYSCMD